MGLSDYLVKLLGSRAGLPSPQGTQIGGRIAYPDKVGYTSNVEHGYRRNPVVAACVGLYASTLNEPPIGVQRSDGRIDTTHPLSLLFRRPNQYMGQSDFWQIVWTYLAISGNCYIKKVRSQHGNVVELIPYSDAYVVPVLDQLGWVYAYEYRSNAYHQTWTRDDVIHLINPAYRDPLKMHMGISPIEVAWDKINTYNELQATMYSLVASNAVPSGILTAPGDIPVATVQILKEQLRKRKNAQGRERTDPLILGSGMSYTQMGLDATKLQANEMLQELEVAICGAFRIHPVVALTSAGLARSTYNNIQSAYAEYTTLTRVPFWNALEEQLEAGLYTEYPGIQIQFDLSQVQALQPDADALIGPVVSMFTANVITQNETRQKLGYESVASGDVFSWEVVPAAPVGFMSDDVEPDTKTEDQQIDSAEEVSSDQDQDQLVKIDRIDAGRVVWNEPYAVKAYTKQKRIVDEYVASSLEDVRRFIDEARRQAIGSIKSQLKAKDPKIRIKELVDKFMTANAKQQERIFTQILDVAVQATGSNLADVQSFIDDIADDQARAITSRMKESGETLQKELNELVRANRGASTAELTDLISTKFETISSGRAGTIARTIGTAQASTVQNHCIKGLNERIPDPNKRFVNVWLSMRDDDVRESHEELDGEWVEVGESFDKYVDGVGSGPGLGDEPGETINCRCITRPVRFSTLGR